jgi:CBS domain containing-hemolysin-like protein
VAVAPKRRPQELTQAEDELQAIVEEIGELSEPLEEQERDMIRRIIGLESTTVREIMVPRPDIIAAEADAPLSTGIDLIVKYGVSRIPIYEDTVDEVVGVVYAKDLLRATHQADAPATLRALARKPHFVPESKKIDELLKELRENHIHMAIVVDEYGGTAGLVSLEDLLEEIVGEIEDEYDRGEVSVQRISPHEAVLDARVSIADLNELFGTSITQEDFATIGGLVYAELGKIPAVGNEIRVDGLTITVLATSGRRIRKVRAVLSEPSEDPED